MQVYLDNAATTKLHPRVLDKMLPYLKENYGNPSAIHTMGRNTRVAIEESRELIADYINADPSEIYFTSSGTEASNFIINGISQIEFEETGKKSIISSAGDHKATLLCVENLSRHGFKSIILPLKNDFQIDRTFFETIDLNDISLATFVHVNNETGNIYDIKELSRKLNGVYFHTDAVQSFGKYKLNVKDLGIHSLSASAHKIYGPKGIGLAYIRSQTPMTSLILGGGQERNRRAGTENVAAIVGFAESVRIAIANMNENYIKVKKLNDYFWKGLVSSGIKELIKNSSSENSPYILSITFNPSHYNNESESMLMFLDIHGIAASSGSACASGTLKPSHVILAAGYSEEYSKGTLRFSFSAENTIAQIDYTISILSKLAEKIRK